MKALGAVGNAMAGMEVSRRRRLDLCLLGVGALVVAGAAMLGARIADGERVTSLWVGGELSGDGAARVVEVIDYDFGSERRHGIFRDVPGLLRDEPVTAVSATAPAAVDLGDVAGQARIRLGDPARTITGRHRYQIRYALADPTRTGKLAWDVVGTAWEVPLGDVEIQLVAPFELEGVRCVHGTAGAQRPCEVDRPAPGRLAARVDHLDAGEGVTLFADRGARLGDSPRLPAPPSGIVADATSGVLPPALLALAAALLAAGATSPLVRKAGRERVPEGQPGGGTRLDAADLAARAGVEAAPPPELTPAQGGVLSAEGVRNEHKVAWLLSAAADGYVELQGDDEGVTLVRGTRQGPAAAALDLAFAGRASLTLGSYDASFAAAWQAIGEELEGWERACGLWDPVADRRRWVVRVLGGVAALAGLGIAGGGAALANRLHPAWLALVVAGALVAGAGLAALVRGWELRMRTPEGSALWLRVESFRRFLAASQAGAVDRAAGEGLVSAYTAWAVALGEIDHWSRAVAGSAIAPSYPTDWNRAALAPALHHAASASSVEPSSSGGGGGGGGVGGGSGGGGGGSW